MDGLEALRRQAEHWLAAGDVEAACRLWQRELALCPQRTALMVELSYAHSHAGRYRDAMDWAIRAAQALPEDAEGRRGLIRRLKTFNEIECLQGVARRLLADPGTDVLLLVEAARALNLGNDFESARACLDAALARAPRHPEVRKLHAQWLVQAGELERAEELFQQLLAETPHDAQTWWLLVRLRRQTDAPDRRDALLALLPRLAAVPQHVALAARALHKVAHDLGEHELAWDALELMCRAKRRIEPHDPVVDRRIHEALMALPTTPCVAVGAGAAVPIFIVGMHRSGTTLLEQLLAASPEVRALGELWDLPAAVRYAVDRHATDVVDEGILQRLGEVDPARIAASYLGGVHWRLADRTVFTDKQPGNYQLIGLICRAFPQARILHLVRDAMDVCFSNLREIYNGINRFSYDQQALAEHYRGYRQLMQHWHARFPGRILDVSHAALTQSPEAVMRQVADFCGIAYVPGMADPRGGARPVATASSAQVRDGIARPAAAWQPYAAKLEPLRRALGEAGLGT